jgi:predicted Zn-dependent peptidase
MSAKYPKPQITKLKNGLRFMHIPVLQTETVLAMVLVGTGADFESKSDNGLAHFLEHMCFKGTTKRPTAKDIAIEFDNIGADYNAFTSRAYTGYYARAHKKHAEKIIEMVSDIYLNPTFPKVEVEKEKGVVTQELNMYMDQPGYRISRLLSQMMYKDQSAGRATLGTKETISSFSRKDLVKYHSKSYSAENTIVVIAGNIDQKKAQSLVQNLFSKLDGGKKLLRPNTKSSQKGAVVGIEYKKTDQVHFKLAFRIPGYIDKKGESNALLKDIKAMSVAFGSSMSSRLFLKMREELGICYYVGSGVHARHDSGELIISAGVEKDRLEEALNGIVDEIVKIKNEGIGSDELSKVKEGWLSGLVLGLETVSDFADFYAFQEILGKKIKHPADRVREIEGLKLENVNKTPALVFDKTIANLAIYGDVKDVPANRAKFLKIVSRI